MSEPALHRIAEIQDPSGRTRGYVVRARMTRVYSTRSAALTAAARAALRDRRK